MITLLLGFIGLVLVPALVLSMILTRLVKEPAESPVRENHCRFTISLDKSRPVAPANRSVMR